MFWFVTFKFQGNEMVKKFCTPQSLFEWLGEHRESTGEWPALMCVYKAECVLDGS